MKEENLQQNNEQLRFKGNKNLSLDLLSFDTPIQFFFNVFSQEVIKKISEETNFYQVQGDPNSAFRVSKMDVRQFIGLVYVISLVQLPRVTNHWSPILGTPLIQETMSLNKFEKIRQTLHFKDNAKFLPRDNPDHDRIFKIRPVVDSLNAAYSKVPIEDLPASVLLSSADFRLEGLSSRRSVENKLQVKKQMINMHLQWQYDRTRLGTGLYDLIRKLDTSFQSVLDLPTICAVKCVVALCYTKTKNYFRNFHLS